MSECPHIPPGITPCPWCEIERLRTDAERYRWLREKPGRLVDMHRDGLQRWLDHSDKTGAEEIDAAIDAGMAADSGDERG